MAQVAHVVTASSESSVWSSEPILDPCRFSLFRLDGHCFSKFVHKEKLTRPFDDHFSKCMRDAAEQLFEEFRFEIAFVGSDEITMVWKPLTEEQLGRGATLPFGGRTQKIVSLLAAFTSVAFYRAYTKEKSTSALPHFDCRFFQVSTKAAVNDKLMERQVFTLKNARSMYAQSFLSQKVLNGLSSKTAVERVKELYHRDFYADVQAYNRIGGYITRENVDSTIIIPAGPRKGQQVKCKRSVYKWSFSWEPPHGDGDIDVDTPLPELSPPLATELETKLETEPAPKVAQSSFPLPTDTATATATASSLTVTAEEAFKV